MKNKPTSKSHQLWVLNGEGGWDDSANARKAVGGVKGNIIINVLYFEGALHRGSWRGELERGWGEMILRKRAFPTAQGKPKRKEAKATTSGRRKTTRRVEDITRGMSLKN